MKVVITDHLFASLEPEQEALRGLAEVVPFREYPGPERFLALAGDADGILCNQAPLTAEVIQSLRRCRVIVRYGIGVDNVDAAAATRRGIPVCNVPDYCTAEVADHTLTLALAVLRKLPASIQDLRNGGWMHGGIRPVRRLSELTFGLYGFGRIARAVAERARGFGFRLAAHDPHVPEAVFSAAGVERVDAETLLGRSDLLSLHMPLTPGTRHLIDRSALERMKPGAMLVNTARGGLVETATLLDALDRGRLGGAALDVLEEEPIPPDHPLWARANVFMTGHLAWYSEEALLELQRKVGEECARVLRGEPPMNATNPDYARVAGDG